MFFVTTCPESPFATPEMWGPFPTWESANDWREREMPRRVTAVVEPERPF